MLTVLIALACLCVIVHFAGDLLAAAGLILAFCVAAVTCIGLTEVMLLQTHNVLSLELVYAIKAVHCITNMF